MASKKKNVDQGSLFGGIEVRSSPSMPLDTFALVNEQTGDVALAKTEPAPAPLQPATAAGALQSIKEVFQEERPKLRLVPPQPDEDVTIEPDDNGFFWLSFVRHDGTTRGAVRITRRQVEMLIARAPVALEMSK